MAKQALPLPAPVSPLVEEQQAVTANGYWGGYWTWDARGKKWVWTWVWYWTSGGSQIS